MKKSTINENITTNTTETREENNMTTNNTPNTNTENNTTIIEKKEVTKMTTLKDIVLANNNTNKALTKQQLIEAGFEVEAKGYFEAVETLRVTLDTYENNPTEENQTSAISTMLRVYEILKIEYTAPTLELHTLSKILHTFGKLRTVENNGEIVKQKSITEETHRTQYGFNVQSPTTFRKSLEKFACEKYYGLHQPSEAEIIAEKARIKEARKAREKAEKEAKKAEAEKKSA